MATKEVKICLQCIKQYQAMRNWQRFCGNHCRYTWHNQKGNQTEVHERNQDGCAGFLGPLRKENNSE